MRRRRTQASKAHADHMRDRSTLHARAHWYPAHDHRHRFLCPACVSGGFYEFMPNPLLRTGD